MKNALGEILMYVSCWGLVVCGVVLFAAKVLAPAWDETRRFFSSQGVASVLLVPLAVGIVLYGGSKSRITFSDGIKDAGNSTVTNDTIHIEWERDTSKIVVPMSAAVYIDYRQNGSTNEWGLLGQSVVSAGFWDYTLADATNYDYHVWAYYIPPEPVHTNGVWTYKTMKDRADKYTIPLRARIEINGKAIATPAEKRKDEEK